jgi:hypothetical protein
MEFFIQFPVTAGVAGVSEAQTQMRIAVESETKEEAFQKLCGIFTDAGLTTTIEGFEAWMGGGGTPPEEPE